MQLNIVSVNIEMENLTQFLVQYVAQMYIDTNTIFLRAFEQIHLD